MCPWDVNIVTSHDFKLEKYFPLVVDLFWNFKVQYYPVEISVHSQVSREAKWNLDLSIFVFLCFLLDLDEIWYGGKKLGKKNNVK